MRHVLVSIIAAVLGLFACSPSANLLLEIIEDDRDVRFEVNGSPNPVGLTEAVSFYGPVPSRRWWGAIMAGFADRF